MEPPRPGSWHVYSTASAEQRDVTLPDGSVATLGGHSVLRAQVTRRSRTAFLDRGEALFRVERNPKQPFTVYAQGGSINVLGTVFDVRNYSDRVQVTVTEGLVQVVPRVPKGLDLPVADNWFSTAKPTASVRVEKGQRVSYRVDGSATDPQVMDPVLATDWTRGVITYTAKPLHEIIEDVQRYYFRPIVLEATVADFNYTGTFSQQNANGWLHDLALIFPVEVVDEGDNLVIRRRHSLGQ